MKRRARSSAYLATRIFDTPLLIHPTKLATILAFLGPRLGLRADYELPMSDDSEIADDDQEDSGETSFPGVCVIPIQGTLVKRSTGMDAASGLTTYSRIQASLAQAMGNDACNAILLDIDSPGGEASGMFDLCNYLTSLRGSKPIIGIANDSAYSAAYCLASACDQLLVTRTGGVGSIGCYMLHCDQSGYDQSKGLKYTYIFSGDHKVDGNPHEPLSTDARADMQAEADKIRDLFVAAVAKNRNVSAKQIYNTEAACFMGSEGCPMLADGVGSFEDALKLALKAAKGSRSMVMANLATGGYVYDARGSDSTAVEQHIRAALQDAGIKRAIQDTARTARAQDVSDGGMCACICKSCMADDCAGCTAEDCDDDNCTDCPMQQDENKSSAARESIEESCLRVYRQHATKTMGWADYAAAGGSPTLAIRTFANAVAKNNEANRITGVVAPYDSLSSDLGNFKEIYQRGCFQQNLDEDDPRVLFNHNPDYVLGRKSAGTARFWEESDGLHYEADAPDTQWAKDLKVSLERGDIRESSAAFYILQHRWEQRGQTRVRVIEKARLVEGGPHSFAAYGASTAGNVEPPASASAEEQQELELIGARLQLLNLQ